MRELNDARVEELINEFGRACYYLGSEYEGGSGPSVIQAERHVDWIITELAALGLKVSKP